THRSVQELLQLLMLTQPGAASFTKTEARTDNCTNYHLQFEWVFSVPGHVAMLNSTLVSRRYFDYTTVPYNITWYNLKTGQEMINQTDKVFVLRETMWFLNVTLEDNGEYVTILRTPSRCFMQSTKLVVEPPIPGECGKPQKAYQELQAGVAHLLNCPLMDYIQKLKKHYRTKMKNVYVFQLDSTKLNIDGVDSHHSGLYTCVLTFTLDGVVGSVSETINATVKGLYFFIHQDKLQRKTKPYRVLYPKKHLKTLFAFFYRLGSRFTKKCLVFVPTVGQSLDPIWFVRDLKASNKTSERIYVSEKMKHDAPAGFLVERLLIFSKVTAEDFNLNYTCLVMSSRVQPPAYFTLIPVEPDLILPVGCVFGSLILVFIMSVTIFYTFRISIVLWFRETFSILYTDKDGKLYDAYVAYSQPQPVGFEEEVEKFALHTLPQVLEETWGYKLFIEGRDGLPGQSKVDSVEENIQASRCFILLYTCSESMHHLECVAAMHRSLLEGSLKVVLVELEELSSDQLALLPESVQHLRKKQGAVCLWKNVAASKRWRKCLRTEEDEEDGGKDSYLSASFCPSSRFWKEVRYQMPVKGRRRVGSRETVLLNK
uniref:TIR domain-containing protein n=1 Tax=Oryzias melastigma TaxID=30732 RepID=A0A3B3DTK9_ORYME